MIIHLNQATSALMHWILARNQLIEANEFTVLVQQVIS